MTKQTRVVIGGGGFGGIKTALLLAQNPRFQIQLISNNTHFEYHGALYRTAAGHSPREVVIPLREIFSQTSRVEVLLDSISNIDSHRQVISTETGHHYPYDAAVLSLGSQVNYFGLPNLAAHTESLQDLSSTLQLRRRLVELFTTPQRKPYRVAIVGGGPTGVELAGEIQPFADMIAKHKQLAPVKVQVILVEASERILPQLSTAAAAKVSQRLQNLGVELHLNLTVESCQNQQLCLSAGNLGADILVWTAGSKPIDFYANNPTSFVLSPRGKVMVDDYLGVQTQRNLYVIGDNAETPYSGMAQTALTEARFVSRHLERLAKNQSVRPYRPRRPIYAISVGPKWAAIQSGSHVVTGYRGWLQRRQADLAIYRQFEPYRQSLKSWRAGNRLSQF